MSTAARRACVCGVEFIPSRSDQRWCSKRCYKRMHGGMHTCATCGQSFGPYRTTQRYCSLACWGVSRRRLPRVRHNPEVACVSCGRVMPNNSLPVHLRTHRPEHAQERAEAREAQRQRRISRAQDPDVRERHRAYLQRPDVKARRSALWAARRASDPERLRTYWRGYSASNPTVVVGGMRVRMSQLPDELRPIAALILETRRELRRRSA